MILVDTSIWIELLNGRLGTEVSDAQMAEFVTCSPVVQEVLQGLRSAPASLVMQQRLRAVPALSDPLSMAEFVEAAEIYRLVRSKGFTLRSGADCLIAAIALRHGATLWHRDRDFDTIARFTGLRCWGLSAPA